MDKKFIMNTIEEIYGLLGEWEELQEEAELDESELDDEDELDEDEDFVELDEDEAAEIYSMLQEAAYSMAKRPGVFTVSPDTPAAKKRFGEKKLQGVFLSTKGGKTIFIPTKATKGTKTKFQKGKVKDWAYAGVSGKAWKAAKGGAKLAPMKKRAQRSKEAKFAMKHREWKKGQKKQAGFEAGMEAWGQSIAPAKKALKKASKKTRAAASRKGKSRKIG